MLCSASPPTSGVTEEALQEDSSGIAQAGPSFPQPFQGKMSAPEPCPLQLRRLVVQRSAVVSAWFYCWKMGGSRGKQRLCGFHVQRALTAAAASLKGGNFHWKGGLPSLSNISDTSARPVKGEIRNSLGGFKPSWVHVYLLVWHRERRAAFVPLARECVRPAGDRDEAFWVVVCKDSSRW